MKTESTVHVAPNRDESAFARIALAATLLLAPAAAHAADPKGGASGGKTPMVTLESVPGSAVQRVTLTAKAAERLGIETGKVSEELVLRKQMVSGLIVPPMEKQLQPKPAGGPVGFGAPPAAKPAGGGFADFGRVPPAAAAQPVAARPSGPTADNVWVLVTLSPREWERLAKDKPARVLPLATRDKAAKQVLAEPTGMAPLEDTKRSMLTLYYMVPGKDHGLTLANRMRVELPLIGVEEKQKVAPYSAVFYDSKGTAWVYVNAKPLTFERQRIAVERVVGDLAVLSEGPPAGTSIVTVGAALLYGAEIFKK
jgi:hypothetical protein